LLIGGGGIGAAHEDKNKPNHADWVHLVDYCQRLCPQPQPRHGSVASLHWMAVNVMSQFWKDVWHYIWTEKRFSIIDVLIWIPLFQFAFSLILGWMSS
jgi:hypothetical protein